MAQGAIQKLQSRYSQKWAGLETDGKYALPKAKMPDAPAPNSVKLEILRLGGECAATPIFEAEKKLPKQINKHLWSLPGKTSLEKDRATAWHASHFNNGLFIHVNKGNSASLKIILTASGNSATHNLIVLGEGASLGLQFISTSADNRKAQFHSETFEAILGENARLSFLSLQDYSPESTVFSSQFISLGKSSSLFHTSAFFGGKLARGRITSLLEGENCSASSTQLFFGEQAQKFDICASTSHFGAGSGGKMDARGVMSGSAHSTYRANIRIGKTAKAATSSQQAKCLLLSNRAGTNMTPSLHVANSNATASHGATISQVPRQEALYLRSRGIEEGLARGMIARGFFIEPLSGFPLKMAGEEIGKRINARLGILGV